MLDGHARVGSWMAIAVHLKNDGPPVAGELRLSGGSQGRTRFGLAGRTCPTQSDKTYLLYAQPPAFGRELEVSLVDGDTTRSPRPRSPSPSTTAPSWSSASSPSGQAASSATIDLLPNQNQVAPADRPARPGRPPGARRGWEALDRLVWQDVDSSRLDREQMAALRGWIAGGGRLVIVGGTSGPNSLSAFPDELLPVPARPRRSTSRPTALTGLLGEVARHGRATCRRSAAS